MHSASTRQIWKDKVRSFTSIILSELSKLSKTEKISYVNIIKLNVHKVYSDGCSTENTYMSAQVPGNYNFLM